MLIQPIRTMRLSGKRVEAGKPVDVPDADAQQAMRHGWAVPTPAKPRKADASIPAEEPSPNEAGV